MRETKQDVNVVRKIAETILYATEHELESVNIKIYFFHNAQTDSVVINYSTSTNLYYYQSGNFCYDDIDILFEDIKSEYNIELDNIIKCDLQMVFFNASNQAGIEKDEQ